MFWAQEPGGGALCQQRVEPLHVTKQQLRYLSSTQKFLKKVLLNVWLGPSSLVAGLSASEFRPCA